ncbi:GWxTD domain-containing protein [Fibrella arboris]|uniref:GWxTD domain-containing protein n=1 Tax=Fibrella arboris TaxID=3242486 RepID=UPI003521EF4B
MRSYLLLPILALLAACAPQKPQFPMPDRSATAQQPTRTRPISSDPTPSRPNTSARSAPSTAVGAAPTSPEQPRSEWVVTAVKGKFLAIDTTAVRVFLNISTTQPNGQPMSVDTFRDRFIANYVIYPDYNNRERLGYGNVPLTAESVTTIGNQLMLTFTLNRPKGATNAILLTELSETGTGKKALNDLPLRFKPTKLSDQFALFDATGRQPQLRNFTRAQDTIMIRDVMGTRRNLYVYRYKHEFDPALPPMTSTQRPAPRTLAIDTTMMVSTNEPIRLPGEGLYYFVADTSDQFGIGVMATDMRFPKMTRPERLVKPLLYMSTGTEIAELNNTKEAKKSLDRYWLSLMAGNEEVAKQAIRAYYNRVEEANQLFTTYKEGWKTDKGMIYIILGSPDRVQRSRDREVWVYNRRNNLSEVNFTFNRKQNQFVEDHYELVRYTEYQPIWYPIVEAWRTGAIRE